MKKSNKTLVPNKLTIENLKLDAAELSNQLGLPNVRDRSVRGVNLIKQLLNCFRIDSVDFGINSMKVDCGRKPLKDTDRELPIFKLIFSEKRGKYKEYFDDEIGLPMQHEKITHYTYAVLKTEITAQFHDTDNKPYTNLITVESYCRMPRVGFPYSGLIRKVLYIYTCSYIMKSRNFIASDGLELHTPYDDMLRDTTNTVKWNTI